MIQPTNQTNNMCIYLIKIFLYLCLTITQNNNIDSKNIASLKSSNLNETISSLVCNLIIVESFLYYAHLSHYSITSEKTI